MDTVPFLMLVLAGMALATSTVVSILGRDTTPVVFLLVFSTFSGYLNNLYDRHPAIHVARFVVLAMIAVFWLLSRRTRSPGPKSPLDGTMQFFFWFYAAQMFNPHWSSLRVAVLNGLIGLVTHGFPILLFFIGREIIRTPRQIRGIYLLLILLSTVMAAYGIYQYERGYDYVAGLGEGFRSTLNREMLWRTDNLEQKIFRPVSFAPDAGTASSFYAVGILLAGALLTGSQLSLGAQWSLLGAIVLQFLALCLTLVRSTMVGTLLGLALVLAAGRRSMRLAISFAALGLLLASVEDPTGGMLVERFQTVLSAKEVTRSRGTQVRAIWWAMSNFPTGMGIGRGGAGGGRFNEPEDSRYVIPPESYFVTLCFETGLVGLFLVFRIFYVLSRYSLIAVMRIRSPDLHPLALATTVVLGLTMLVSFVGPTLYAAPLCYLFWTIAGLLFRIIELEGAERSRRLARQSEGATT